MTKADSKMRVCVLWVVFSVAFAAERNSTCEISVGKYGTCVPVESCSVGTTHLHNGALDFDSQLQCGHDDDGPLICCESTFVERATLPPRITVGPPIPTEPPLPNLKENAPCVTPNEENGTCISIRSCSSLLQSLYKTKQDAEFARKSQCGVAENIPLVCCRSEKATRPSFHSKTNSRCVTPSNEEGVCKPFHSCISIQELISGKEKESIAFAVNSQCGFENGPLVCCSDRPPNQIKLSSSAISLSQNESCITPNQERGKCIAVNSEKTAPPSINSNNIHLKPNSPCVTPNNEEGICKPYSSCKSIHEPVQRKEKGAEAFAIKSQCGSENYENEALVCCSDRPPNQVKLSSSAISLSQNESCITPNRERGNCIPVNSCAPIKKAIKFFDPEAIHFARASLCGNETSPMVCCGSLGMYSEPPTSTPQVLPVLNSQSTSRRTETAHMELNSRNDGRIIPPLDSDVSSSPAFGVKLGGLTLSQVPARSPINAQNNNGRNKIVPYSNRVSPVDADVTSSPVIGARLDGPPLQQVAARSPINAENNNGRNKNVPYSNRVSPVDTDVSSSPVITFRLDGSTLQQVPARSSINSQNNNGRNKNVPYSNRVSPVDADVTSSPVIGARLNGPTLQQVPARSSISSQNNNGQNQNVPYSNRVSVNHRQQQTDEFEPVKTDVGESNPQLLKNHFYPCRGNPFYNCPYAV